MNQYTEKVKEVVEWAELVAKTPRQIKSKYKDAVCINNKKTDTQGVLLNISGALTIAFRGSMELPDWIRDFEAWQVVIPYENQETKIRVHSGFIGGYKSVRNTIHTYIKENKAAITSIFICGHSLGGALATLCAVDIQYNFPDITLSCHTIGSPKVGNKDFADSFIKRVPNSVRTYMRKDLVPELPPAKFGRLQYTHVEKANPIGPKGIFDGLIQWFREHFTNDFAGLATNHSSDLYKQYA